MFKNIQIIHLPSSDMYVDRSGALIKRKKEIPLLRKSPGSEDVVSFLVRIDVDRECME